MKKILKTFLIVCIFLLIGGGFAFIEYSGRKSSYKSRINLLINVGPDSLRGHLPDIDLLDNAIYTTVAPENKREIGGAYLEISIEKNHRLDEFFMNLTTNEQLFIIEREEVFNVVLNYRERKYDFKNHNENKLYPLPELISLDNFDEYKIIYFDFGKGIYLNKDNIKENSHLHPDWRHGYTRGVAVNQKNEYNIWLIIW
jgi:hypothetical protein